LLNKKFVLALLKEIASEHSGDRRTKVAAGCYIDGILKWGVNHLEYELPEEDIAARTALFYATMVHAEADLCTKIGEQLQGKTVYVTLFPCDGCAKKLIQGGVEHIVVGEDRPDAPYIIEAKRLLEIAGISWEVIES